MKLREIILKNFGKFTDKTIDFDDGINVLYGENESGKSTIHTFIRSMLFGMDRGRGRASLNDTYSQYEPWDNPNYYAGVLKFESGGKQFTIQRNFDKYSKSAELYCETDGEELSVEDGDLSAILGGLSEDVYANTVSIGQMRVEPSEKLSDSLKNFAANYYASGDADLNLAAAFAKLKERKKTLEKEISAGRKKKEERKNALEQEASYIWQDVHRLQGEMEDEEEAIAKAQEEEKNKAPEKKHFHWRVQPVVMLTFIVLIALCFIVLPRPWGYLVTLVVALLCGIYVWNRFKVAGENEENAPGEAPEEPESLQKRIWDRDRTKEEWQEKSVQYNNLKEQIKELEETEDDFREQEEEISAITLAQEHLQVLSDQMQEQMKQVMNGRVSEIVEELTNGKYTHLQMEDDYSIRLWQNDRLIPADKLSRGTIEQIYFALRMASAEMMQPEECPVLLDDTFVYYDDERLAATLRWLSQNKKQVLLFTCQRREKEALDQMQIPYCEKSF